jgi:hypothetical protein
MSTFWQTVISAVIPAALALLVAYRGAISSTSRLISAIRVNVELLDKLPADSPGRAKLEAQNGELVDVLAWRQHQQFHRLPWSTSPGLLVTISLAVAGLLGVALTLAGATGAYRHPVAPEILRLTLAFYTAVTVATVGLFRSTSKLAREQRQLLQADAEPSR